MAPETVLTTMQHEQRLKEAYEKRKAIPANRYSLLNPANLFMLQSRERALSAVFAELHLHDFKNLRILDIGCGSGGQLLNFLHYGAMPQNLCGIDLLPERVNKAKTILPASNIRLGNATDLPWPDNSFDIAVPFTVFTSILEPEIKKQASAEILRALKPGGILLWYDFHMDNPANPDVRGVKKAEIAALFPDCKISLKRITLAPPLTRMIAPFSIISCQLLEKLRILNTHYLGYIRKP